MIPFLLSVLECKLNPLKRRGENLTVNFEGLKYYVHQICSQKRNLLRKTHLSKLY